MTTHAEAIRSAEYAEFLAGYRAALFWSSTDDLDGETVNLDDFETSTQADDTCRADCLAFFVANYADICAAAGLYPSRGEYGGFSLAGHDFALTRNGHGAGFWDGDLPEALGERLTAASKTAGECWPYIGDDGEVYM